MSVAAEMRLNKTTKTVELVEDDMVRRQEKRFTLIQKQLLFMTLRKAIASLRLHRYRIDDDEFTFGMAFLPVELYQQKRIIFEINGQLDRRQIV